MDENKDIKSWNIFQRMAAVTQECPVIEKTLKVEKQNGKGYSAVGEADILAKIKPLEAKYGIYSYPYSRNRESSIETREFRDAQTGAVRTSRYMLEKIETVYRFVNVDKPDEHIDVKSFGTGMDSYDKAFGKAMTYSDKYALIKAYKIVTGNNSDPDAYATPDSVPDGFVDFGADGQGTLLGNNTDEKSPAPAAASSRQMESETVLKPSTKEQPKTAKSQQPVKQETVISTATKEAKTDSVPTQTRFTPEQARQFQIPYGSADMKGKNLGEILALEPNKICWWAFNEKYLLGATNKKFPEVREACLALAKEAYQKLSPAQKEQWEKYFKGDA